MNSRVQSRSSDVSTLRLHSRGLITGKQIQKSRDKNPVAFTTTSNFPTPAGEIPRLSELVWVRTEKNLKTDGKNSLKHQ